MNTIIPQPQTKQYKITLPFTCPFDSTLLKIIPSTTSNKISLKIKCRNCRYKFSQIILESEFTHLIIPVVPPDINIDKYCSDHINRTWYSYCKACKISHCDICKVKCVNNNHKVIDYNKILIPSEIKWITSKIDNIYNNYYDKWNKIKQLVHFRYHAYYAVFERLYSRIIMICEIIKSITNTFLTLYNISTEGKEYTLFKNIKRFISFVNVNCNYQGYTEITGLLKDIESSFILDLTRYKYKHSGRIKINQEIVAVCLLDTRTFAVASWKSIVEIYQSQKLIRSIPEIATALLKYKNEYLITAKSTISIYDLISFNIVTVINSSEKNIKKIVEMNTGLILTSSMDYGNLVYIWDTHDPTNEGIYFKSAEVAPMFDIICLSNEKLVISAKTGLYIWVMNTPLGQGFTMETRWNVEINNIVYSMWELKNGNIVLGLLYGRMLCIDCHTYEILNEYIGHSSVILVMKEWDEHSFVSLSQDHTCIVWNNYTCMRREVLDEHKARIEFLVCGKDGWMITGTNNGEFMFWDKRD